MDLKGVGKLCQEVTYSHHMMGKFFPFLSFSPKPKKHPSQGML